VLPCATRRQPSCRNVSIPSAMAHFFSSPPSRFCEIGFPLKELGTKFMRGKGCDQCRQTGYQGRAAIYEICVVTEPLRKMIMQKRDGGELKQCAIAEGMETLRQDGWRRVAQGSTTIEEVVRVTQTDEV